MKNASRYAFAILSFALLVAGLVLVLQRFVGESESSYLVPCVLSGLGAGFGLLAWYFNTWFATPALCTPGEDDETETKPGLSEALEGEVES